MNEEQVIFRGSPSILTRGGHLMAALLLIVGGITGAILLHKFAWAFLGVGLAGIIYLIVTIVQVRARVYEVTTQRIRFTCGILTKRTDELELYRVQDTTLIEPFFLRLARRGNIQLQTNDATTPTFLIEAIQTPRILRENLRKYVEECRDRKGVRVREFE